ncbi:MAG: copper resistance CopC/CopD family protein [Gemmatimonadaceae bacterium]
MTTAHRRTRVGLSVPIATLALLIFAAPLFAHAHLRRSAPGAGASLAAPPSTIHLWFTEAPELALSGVTLSDSAGAPVAVGALSADPRDRLAVHAPIIGAMHAGRYTVHWHAVASDGHPSSGSFTFAIAQPAPAGVGRISATPSGMAGVARASATAAPPADAGVLAPADVAVRWLWFTATLIAIGAIVFRLAVLDAAHVGAKATATIARRLAVLGALAAAALLAVACLRLGQQQALLAGDGAGAKATLDVVIGHTAWGRAWMFGLASAVLALLALGSAMRRDTRSAWAAALVAGVGLALAPAFGGHAAASAQFTIAAVADDAVHVFAASSWLGGLCCLALVAMPVLVRSPAADRWKTVAFMVNAFSPVALGGAVLVALSGGVSAWLRVRTVHALLTSSYGHVLELKLALVLLTVGVGAYSWRRARPALGTEAATARLRRSAAAELTLALAVLVVTAVLVAMDLPTS